MAVAGGALAASVLSMTEPEGRAEDIDEALEDDDPETLQDEVSGGMSADDRPEIVESYGNTAAETRHGESLAQQLAEESPDVGQTGDPVDDVVADHPELDPDAEPELAGLSQQDIDGGDPSLVPSDGAEQILDPGTRAEDRAAEDAAVNPETD